MIFLPPRCALIAGLAVALLLPCPLHARDRLAEGEARWREAVDLADRGQLAAAVERWREAERLFGRARATSRQIDSLLQEAAAGQKLGQFRLAAETAERAEVLAEKSGQRMEVAKVKATRGAIFTFGRRSEEAEPLLRDALKLAREEKSPGLTASILNDLGVVLSARAKTDEALKAFGESAALAREHGAPELAARALRNSADAALAAKRFEAAEQFARQTASAAASLPDQRGKAFLLMGAAQVLQRTFIDSPAHDNALRAEAFRLHQQAQKVAEKLGDEHTLAFALGYQGALYEFEQRPAEALALTRRAVFAAQRAQSPDAQYRCQWQAGRLLGKLGDRASALESYRRAVATLQSIRNDVAIRYGNRTARSSFREAVGAVYFELADLLLQEADSAPEGEPRQALLREARGTSELLKAAELEDYFQDDCVNLLKSKTKKIESLSPTAVVIYVVPLPTRTELLVSLPSGKLERFKAGVNDELLTETVRIFRRNLEDRTTEAYIEQAQQIHRWLLQPLAPLLASGGFDTLVFVPDGALRTIPMAALHDGEKFLIERYAIAVTPGLELMEATPVARVQPQIMINGLSESVEGFPALTNVPEEIARISQLYGRHDALMNRDFRAATVGQRLTSNPFTIVHIASHGQFAEDVRKSFVLTFDQRLTLDDLERYIRPAQLRDQALELLTLSACQTAAGDDRAALGLAGVAVKAGARSAFATLWFVNDAASTQLVSAFYTGLTRQPQRSKAHALQQAQVQLLTQERYAHPCYWAPYLLIGNWL